MALQPSDSDGVLLSNGLIRLGSLAHMLLMLGHLTIGQCGIGLPRNRRQPVILTLLDQPLLLIVVSYFLLITTTASSVHLPHSLSSLTAALVSMNPKSTLCPNSSLILLIPYFIIVGLSRLSPKP